MVMYGFIPCAMLDYLEINLVQENTAVCSESWRPQATQQEAVQQSYWKKMPVERLSSPPNYQKGDFSQFCKVALKDSTSYTLHKKENDLLVYLSQSWWDQNDYKKH